MYTGPLDDRDDLEVSGFRMEPCSLTVDDHGREVYRKLKVHSVGIEVEDWCEAYNLPYQAVFSVASHGAGGCRVLAAAWAHKMAFFYTNFVLESFGEPQAREAYKEPPGIQLGRLPRGGRTQRRMEQIRRMIPSRAELVTTRLDLSETDSD